MIDIDSVEWREGEGIVAFIETALKPDNMRLCDIIDNKDFEFKVLSELSLKTGIRSYAVFHNQDLTTFWIFLIANAKLQPLKTCSENECKDFIKNLHAMPEPNPHLFAKKPLEASF
jgi:hypothetical protein